MDGFLRKRLATVLIPFFLVFSLKSVSLRNKVYILGSVFLFVALLSSMAVESPTFSWPSFAEYYSHHLSFPLGALFCLYYDKLCSLPKKLFAAASAGGLVLYLLCSMGAPELFPYYMTNLSFLFFIIPLSMLLEGFGLRCALLGRLGGIAYEIYLFEFAVMTAAFLFDIPDYLKTLLIFAVVILVSVPVKWLDGRLTGLAVRRSKA